MRTLDGACGSSELCVMFPMEIPFCIDKKSNESLIDQVADGLRRSIVGGVYPKGLILPTLEQFSKGLGVSMNVMRHAFIRIKEEGLVKTRRHVGSVVQAVGTRLRRGHVLVVLPDGGYSYFTNALVRRFSDVMSRRGYLVSEIAVVRGSDGRYDFTRLRLEMRGAVDLAVLVFRERSVEKVLAESDVRLLVYDEEGSRVRPPRHCVGRFRGCLGAALPQIVEQCLSTGVRDVLVAHVWGGCASVAAAFSGTGITVREWQIGSGKVDGSVEEFERAGMDAFSRRISQEGLTWLPDLLIFPDEDHLALGALMALSYAGVKIPEKVRVVSLSNKGNELVYPRKIAQILVDPYDFGERIARGACDFLNGRKGAVDAELATIYMPGESFPVPVGISHLNKMRCLSKNKV